MDWHARRGSDMLRVLMVSPADLTEVLGELTAAQGSSVSQGYYTDTRCTASVSVTDWERYVPGAWLRLVHEVRGSDYSRDLFTGFPTEDPSELRGGRSTASVTLRSSIYAMSQHVYPYVLTAGAGATASAVLGRICDADSRPRRFLAGFADAAFTSTRTFDACSTISEMCFDVCDFAGDRMDVDGDGVVTFGRYLAPSERSSELLLDATAPDSLVVAGSLKRTCDRLSLPNAVAVSWKDGDEEVTAEASLPPSHARSAARTGVTLTDYRELQDMAEPHTVAHAQQLATAYLQADAAESVEWECETLWWEASEGMVVDFDPGDGDGPRKCLVKNVDSTMGAAWTHKLTLKEA